MIFNFWKKVFLFFCVFLFMISFVLAAAPVYLADQGTGVKSKSTGQEISSASITVSIYDDEVAGSLVYTEMFATGIQNGNWNLILGEDPSNPLYLDYGKKYFRDYSIGGIDVDFRDYQGNVIERQPFFSSLGTIPGSGAFVGRTNSTYTATLSFGNTTGYDAANQICSSEFFGSHLCTEFEIIGSISLFDLSLISDWTGVGWVSAGGAKFSPADTPANDCNGFTHGVPGTFLGTFWIFEKPNGGKSALGHCGNDFSLACCR